MNIKGNKKCFYIYINGLMVNKDNMGPLLTGAYDLIRIDLVKTEIPNAFFVQVFNKISQDFVPKNRAPERELPLVEMDQTGNLSEILDPCMLPQTRNTLIN